MLNGHGDDGYLYDTPIIANFSSNVFYDGFPDSLKNHLTNALTHVKRYPDVEAKNLLHLLAPIHNLAPRQLLITNGATEAFYLIAHAFRGQSATIFVPAFAEYEDACRAHDISLEFILWDEIANLPVVQSKLVFVCNPNNPTGLVIAESVLEKWVTAHPQVMFIIDEAYIDFTTSIQTSMDLVHKHDNIIIVRSMTKTYTIPGLRLGYLVSHPEIVSQIMRIKMPWSVNSLAIEAGMYILQHKEKFKMPLDSILQNAQQLQHTLSTLPFLQITTSFTNFFLCKTEINTAAVLKKYLIENHGILIRDASNFRSLTSQHFRIASQNKANNGLLIHALTAWYQD